MAEPHSPGNTMITGNLPSEILFFQILPRLPAKALPTFMCVCKKWHSFIKSRLFFNTYHHHHQNHPKHLVISTPKPYDFRTFDCESPKDTSTAVRQPPFPIPCLPSYNPGNMTVLSSLHGLLCVGIKEDQTDHKYIDLVLWNPLTGEYKTLSKKGCHEECYKESEGTFGLYYASSDDDYKLLRVTPRANIYIYTLRSDSWRQAESTDEDFQQRASNWDSPERYWAQLSHILLNEKLYLLNHVGRIATFIRSYPILRFDIETEKFTEIAVPSFGNRMTDCLGFMVLRGCIHFCVAILIEEETYMTNECCYEMIEMWRMDGDGDWTKVLTYGPTPIFIWGQTLLHVMWNGNLLIRHKGDVYLLDIKNHTTEMVFKCESFDHRRPKYIEAIPIIEKYIETIPSMGKYIETTLSPNRYV